MGKRTVHVELLLTDRERARLRGMVDAKRLAGERRVTPSSVVRDMVRTGLAKCKASPSVAPPKKQPRGVIRVRVNPREDADRWWKHAARLAETSPMFARTLRALEATDEDVTASEAWLKRARELPGFSGAPLVINRPMPKYDANFRLYSVMLTSPLNALLRKESERSGVTLRYAIRGALSVPLKWTPSPSRSKAAASETGRREANMNVRLRFSFSEWRDIERRAAEYGLNESVLIRAHACSALLKSRYLSDEERATIRESWIYSGKRADRSRGKFKPWASGRSTHDPESLHVDEPTRRFEVYMRPEMKRRLREVAQGAGCTMQVYARKAIAEHGEAVKAWLVGQAYPTDVPLYVPNRHVQDGAIGVPLTKGERDTLTAAALRTGASETAFVRACLAWAIAPKADGAKGHPLDTYRHWVWHGTPGDRHPSMRRFMVPRFDVSSIVREAFVRHGEREAASSPPPKAA